MRAGNLRSKAIIQHLVSGSKNEFGEELPSNWVDFKTVWCSITPVSGKESFLSNADFSKVTHKIKIRYTEGLNASMKLVWKGRYFNFTSIRNISERDKEIEILAEENINGN